MYAVRIDSVREILEVTHMTPLPLMPSFVRGVMNLRGAVVPVVDLAARMGLTPAVVAKRSCVVMIDVRRTPEAPVYPVGILVDAVYEVFDAGPDEQEAPPRLGARIDVNFIRSMVRLRGKPTLELQLDVILDPTVLAEMIATHPSLH
jgi:purine-binding chemotaxis protein CheW